ncbi:DNA topoisomerase IB [Dyella sp. ASV21]|uniref:DNA topoisomerase IB n=1 Tax=Dyella sp. ASV21 TaxID=2795114 RepID=UPI0018EDF74D|nr:DNA topoisomerase IB [Dyella sp. ASV21]
MVYVSDTQPGIRRQRAGKGFTYHAHNGQRIVSNTVLARIRALAIPPAYTDVWICANPQGHLQATGRDAKGRKQYRYHTRWREKRDKGKFAHLIEFGEALPRLRRRVRSDLARPGLPQEKVIALIVRLLDETQIRIGNEAYTQENGSYGLTTLRSRHVRFAQGRLYFRFRAKSGKESRVALDNHRLVRLIRRLQALPKQHLFQYKDDAGRYRPIDSGMVNRYLRDISGGDFTAKEFRTWKGTTQAIALLADTGRPESTDQKAMDACIAQVVKQVAAVLRNTPAVCRASYIHPDVFQGWRDGRLLKMVPKSVVTKPRQLEMACLRFLRGSTRSSPAKSA